MRVGKSVPIVSESCTRVRLATCVDVKERGRDVKSVEVKGQPACHCIKTSFAIFQSTQHTASNFTSRKQYC